MGEVSGSPVVNTIPRPGIPGEDLKTGVAIGLKGCTAGQQINVKVTSPAGLVSSASFQLQ